MTGFLKSAAGVLAVLLCAGLLAAGVWFWSQGRARAERMDGTLVFEDGESAAALAVPADILFPVVYAQPEVRA